MHCHKRTFVCTLIGVHTIVNRRRRRHKPAAAAAGAAVRKVGDAVTWERFPSATDDNDDPWTPADTFNFGLKHALVELSMGACGIGHLPAELLDDLHMIERLHLWGNFVEKKNVQETNRFRVVELSRRTSG